jgi:hypothetical protein
MFTSIAAPPNRAAAPTAAVFIGTPAPWEEDDVCVPLAIGLVLVGVGTPEVKGTPAVPVPVAVKAGAPVLAVGSGLTVLLDGLRTL